MNRRLPINNVQKEHRGIVQDEDMGEAGVTYISLEVADWFLRGLGVTPEERREWHDIEFTAYQDVEEYECPECEVRFSLNPFGVREFRCHEHSIDKVRILGEDGEVVEMIETGNPEAMRFDP